jgi:hypothetical protein
MSRAPSCCLQARTCLPERQRAMRQNGPFGWQIPCMDCVEGCARQMDNHVPDPDVSPDPYIAPAAKPRGPKPKAACGRGHLRSVYGRRQGTGRDRGGWSCKACEKIQKANRKAKKEAA